ncbi:hypothetical protein AB835_05030 [Candidatus Endobugula sertula]|uniref:Thioredoxin n=1 Tax=Candidatus Endobugula sertula TaxID=62101 RepID=A0A1D2QRN0_9GAMM|nr:hypothetical protein AB835_05030 [Candidatus Endobugula sertula]
MTENILYYVQDPMCSWCWAFRPAWNKIKEVLANFDTHPLSIQYIAGGLAPDTDEPMSADIREYVQWNWRRIQKKVPGTEFNYDFWDKCEPRRSTYAACRAVIAARQQGAQYEDVMIHAIQQAYYLKAKNPSNSDTLFECATAIGLKQDHFLSAFQSHKIEQLLQEDIMLYHQLAAKVGISGFPSLVLSLSDHLISVPIDYNQPFCSLDFIMDCLLINED